MAFGFWTRVTLDEAAGCPAGASNTTLIYVNGDGISMGLQARGQKKCDHLIAQSKDYIDAVMGSAPGVGAMTLDVITGRSSYGTSVAGTAVPTVTIRNISSAKNVSLKMLPSAP